MEEQLRQIVDLIDQETQEFQMLQKENQQLHSMIQRLEYVTQSIELPSTQSLTPHTDASLLQRS